MDERRKVESIGLDQQGPFNRAVPRIALFGIAFLLSAGFTSVAQAQNPVVATLRMPRVRPNNGAFDFSSSLTTVHGS